MEQFLIQVFVFPQFSEISGPPFQNPAYATAYFHTKGAFRPEAKRNLYCTLEALSMPFPVVAIKEKTTLQDALNLQSANYALDCFWSKCILRSPKSNCLAIRFCFISLL